MLVLNGNGNAVRVNGKAFGFFVEITYFIVHGGGIFLGAEVAFV
jgi:hypothetical protein